MSEHHPRIVDVSSVHQIRPAEPERLPWHDVLRGLREARGVTQDGWAALLGYGRATIHRWERGEAIPGPDAVEALLKVCAEQGLLRRFERGRLCGLTITDALLREVLAEARVSRRTESSPRARPESDNRGAPGDHVREPRPFVVPIPSPVARQNLPLPLTSFLGREAEVAAVCEMLSGSRLVTLTGAGGCGKSRLALEIARSLVGSYPDGVWLVELAPLADGELVPHVIARTLGIAAAPGESSAATLVAALGGRQLLLLLDNCEHLVEASAQLAEDILQHCPGARILATSREALGIPGEVRRGVPPLAVPPDDAALPLGEVTRYAAARLFIDRARAVLPTFEPREGEARALARLCRRLDGIPLAIELAAAQVAVLSVQQIEARLDQRFQLLLGGSRTALPRHQTLSALVAWSYDLLGEAERRVFERLSVFTGTFSLEAIEEVGGGADIAPAAVVPLLARLVGKSLVVAEPDAAGSPCYRLLETLRQFGWERLAAAGQAKEAAERHARHYLALAQAGERGMRGPDQVEWLQRLDAEHDNLRAGLAWLERNGQIPAALRLAGSLTLFWAIRGYYSEGRAHLERLLAYDRATENYPERGKALWGIGTLAARQGDTDVLRSCFEESLACATRAGDRLTIIGAAIGLARCEADTNLGRARDWLTIALGHALAVGDRSSLAAILITRSILAAHEGQIVAAQTIAEEAVAMSREIGDAWQLGWALHFAAAFVLARGDYATARARFEEMLKLARALADRSTIANALTYLGQVAVEEHTPEGASARFAEALAIYRDRGDQAGIVLAASRLAGVYLAEGDVNLARSLAEESLLASADAGTHSRAVALLGRGDVALAAGDVAAARQYFVEGLSLLDLAGPVGPIAQFLLALARVAAARNQQRRALRLIGRADTAPGWPPLRPASVDRHLLDQALARLQAEAGGLTAEEQLAARAEGAAMTTGQAVGYALAADGD